MKPGPSSNPPHPKMTPPINRRRFLQLSTGSAFAAGGLTLPGGARAADLAADAAVLYQRVIPARKGLTAGWVRSLVERDAPDDAPIISSNKASLPHIGMTVGGIGAGTMYLTGDGRLAVWDIFNQPHEGVVPGRVAAPGGLQNIEGGGPTLRERDGANYVRPPTPETHPVPFRQGFALETAGRTRPLDASAWDAVSFRGDWPVGRVEFTDPACPVRVRLAAWSPFIPLDVANSTLPVTVMDYEIENTGATAVEAVLTGTLENPVLHRSARARGAQPRQTTILRDPKAVMLAHGPGPANAAAPPNPRPDIVFDDFERESYAPWVSEGTAFGAGPVPAGQVPAYQGGLGIHGQRAVNSHSSAPGDSIAAKDAAVGSLTSPEFVIERHFITMLLGGGRHPQQTGVELLIDGAVAASVTGRNDNRMHPAAMDVRPFAGKTARLRIIDRATGAWGNVGIDRIVFSDLPPAPDEPLDQAGDFGTIVLAAVDPQAAAGPSEAVIAPDTLRVPLTLAPGESRRITFLVAWHFPNLAPLPGLGRRRPHYATRFPDATAVARDVLARLGTLRERTFAWVATWYDSTLPRWLMDRAVLTANTLQTATCQFLDDGRFWAWEGVGCCPGTCNHVWHYAQSIARLFPALERSLREMVDFGIALNPDGGVRFRGEAGGTIAVDGQAAVVLRTWREHLCSVDDAFLKRVWPGAKRALEWLMRFDENSISPPCAPARPWPPRLAMPRSPHAAAGSSTSARKTSGSFSTANTTSRSRTQPTAPKSALAEGATSTRSSASGGPPRPAWAASTTPTTSAPHSIRSGSITLSPESTPSARPSSAVVSTPSAMKRASSCAPGRMAACVRISCAIGNTPTSTNA